MSDAPTTTSTASRTELMRRAIPGAENLEAVMYLLSLPPGATAPAHRHPGIGVGYVLEGVYESQYEGEELKRFTAGDSIYDLAYTPHAGGRPSDVKVRVSSTYVVEKGKPLASPA